MYHQKAPLHPPTPPADPSSLNFIYPKLSVKVIKKTSRKCHCAVIKLINGVHALSRSCGATVGQVLIASGEFVIKNNCDHQFIGPGGFSFFSFKLLLSPWLKLRKNGGYKNAFAFLIVPVLRRNYRFLRKSNVVRSAREKTKKQKKREV